MKKILLALGILFSTMLSFSLEIKDGNVIDKNGNSIPAKEYKKIIVTAPDALEILIKIGGEESIAAIGKTKRSKIYPEEKVDKLEVIGDIVNLNFEKVIQYKPDLIIVNGMMLKAIPRLKQLGFDVIVSSSSNLESIISNIEALGVIAGKNKNAKVLMEKSLEKLEKLKEKNSNLKNSEKLKGVILFSASPMMSFSTDSLPGDVLKHLAVINIADGVLGERPILSPEYILKENPDFIAGAMSFRSADQIINASNVIPETKAGKNKNIFLLDSSIILRGSYRIFDEIEKLREKLEKISK